MSERQGKFVGLRTSQSVEDLKNKALNMQEKREKLKLPPIKTAMETRGDRGDGSGMVQGRVASPTGDDYDDAMNL